MQPRTKKTLIIIGIVLAVFILTNPSIKRFKEYVGENSYKGLRRKMNFAVCSVYQDGTRTYFAIAWNFFYIGEYSTDLASSNYSRGRKPRKPTKSDYED